MAQHLAQRLIDHRNVRLAAQGIPKLPLHHRERRLDIRPLVVVRQKLLAPEHEVVVHVAPHPAALPFVMVCKRNVWCSAQDRDRVHIGAARISLVGRDFGYAKVLRCRFQKRRQLTGIARVPLANFDCRNDVSLDPAHQVALDPIVLLPNFAVLVVKPASESGRSETAGIDGKVYLNGFQGQAALGYQAPENWGKVGIFKIAENRIVVGRLGYETAHLGLAQIGHKPASTNSGVDLECRAENSIGHWQLRAAHLLRLWFRYTAAQIAQEGLEFIFFVGLRGIVSGPSLRVSGALSHGESSGFGDSDTAVRVPLALHHEGSGKDVLALRSAITKVRAFAGRKLGIELHPVHPLPGLRRYEPPSIAFANRSRGSKFKAPLFADVHFLSLQLLPQCSYNVATCQEQTLLLTCGYISPTLWRMVKSKKRTRQVTATKALKSDVIRIRVTAEQKKALTDAAEREALELSAWLRQLGLRAAGVLPEAK